MTESVGDKQEGENVSAELRGVIKSRTVVLGTAIIDFALVAAFAGLSLWLHHWIGDLAQYPILDRIVIVALQVIGNVGVIGPMLGHLIKDLRIAWRRAWEIK